MRLRLGPAGVVSSAYQSRRVAVSSGPPLHPEVLMRPLVIVLSFFLLLALAACQSGSGPSSALDAQPALGAGLRVFAGPQDGVGVDARLDLGKYGCRTGRAAEPPPVAAQPAAEACPGGVCPVPSMDPLRVPEALAPDAGNRP